MNRKYIISLIISLSFVLPVSAQKDIVILHTSDTHSQIYPFSKNLSDTMRAGRAGYLRVISLVDEERKKNPDLLLFDCGDFSEGSAYYSMYHGDVEIGLMNMMGVDATTIGNHEFDCGLDNLVRLVKKANFPFVCANYDFGGTVLEGLVKPYIVIRRKGVKIGVFGLSPALDGLVSKKDYDGVKYNDPILVARETVEKLKHKEKCDIVICLSHLGWHLDGLVTDDVLVPATTGIDVVLGGHTHLLFEHPRETKNAEGKPVPVMQIGKSGVFVSRLDLKLK